MHVSSFTYSHDDYWESIFEPLTVQSKLLDIACTVAWIKCAFVMISSCPSCYALVVTIHQLLWIWNIITNPKWAQQTIFWLNIQSGHVYLKTWFSFAGFHSGALVAFTWILNDFPSYLACGRVLWLMYTLLPMYTISC